MNKVNQSCPTEGIYLKYVGHQVFNDYLFIYYTKFWNKLVYTLLIKQHKWPHIIQSHLIKFTYYNPNIKFKLLDTKSYQQIRNISNLVPRIYSKLKNFTKILNKWEKFYNWYIFWMIYLFRLHFRRRIFPQVRNI